MTISTTHGFRFQEKIDSTRYHLINGEKNETSYFINDNVTRDGVFWLLYLFNISFTLRDRELRDPPKSVAIIINRYVVYSIQLLLLSTREKLLK